MIIVLDTFLASSVSKRRESGEPTLTDLCHQWIVDCELAGHQVLIPAIAYYETLRELERRQATSQIERLKRFCLQPHRFIPLKREHLETAAQLWGQSRRKGLPTAHPQALDGDVILAAQTLSLGVPRDELIVATTNLVHLSQFVPADLWTNIRP